METIYKYQDNENLKKQTIALVNSLAHEAVEATMQGSTRIPHTSLFLSNKSLHFL